MGFSPGPSLHAFQTLEKPNQTLGLRLPACRSVVPVSHMSDLLSIYLMQMTQQAMQMTSKSRRLPISQIFNVSADTDFTHPPGPHSPLSRGT